MRISRLALNDINRLGTVSINKEDIQKSKDGYIEVLLDLKELGVENILKIMPDKVLSLKVYQDTPECTRLAVDLINKKEENKEWKLKY